MQINKLTMRAWYLLSFLLFAQLVSGEDVSDVLTKVSAGVDAGNAIADILTSDQMVKKVSDFVGKLAPFLGAIGPVLSLIMAFIPAGPSPEMLYMKNKFAEMDAKFDRVFTQFGEVKNLIKETSLKSQYGPHEQSILALSARLQYVLTATDASANGAREIFKEFYQSQYEQAALHLYNGMMEKGMILTDNIPATAMQYTKYDRKQVMHMMQGVTQLICQGVKLQLAYYIMVGRNASYEREKSDWVTKLRALTDHIQEVDAKVTAQYTTQFPTDISDLAARYKGRKNYAFANILYTYLSNKYYWRLWWVVVYDDIRGSDVHWVQACSGKFMFRTHGFNIVVATEDPKYAPLSLDYAVQSFNKIPLTGRNWWGVSYTRDAIDIYDDLPSSVRTCSYPGVAVIRSSADVTVKAPSGRYKTYTKSPYFFSVFS